MRDLKRNLSIYITGKVKKGKRFYKIIDGTAPLKKAHVFFEGTVKNEGNSPNDYKRMGEQTQIQFKRWIIENQQEVESFYIKQIPVKDYQLI